MPSLIVPQSSVQEITAFLEANLDSLPLRPFNHDEHQRNVEQMVEMMDDMELAMSIIMEPETMNPNDDMNTIMGAFSNMATLYNRAFLDFLSMQRDVKIENDVCHICLEDKAREPIYCFQCMKVVGCSTCIAEFVSHHEVIVKCLNCQRKSCVDNPLFFPVRL